MATTAFRPPAQGFVDKMLRESTRPFRQVADGDWWSRRLARRGGRAAADTAFDPGVATTSPEELAMLRRLTGEAAKHPGPIVEIGTLIGQTTTQIALAKRPDQLVITVDNYAWNPWGLSRDAHEATAECVLRYLVETGHVDRVSMDKADFYDSYSGPAPAMVFLDAMHDYEQTKLDIEWSQRVGARIISGHDYKSDFPGVIQIVDEVGGPQELAGSVWRL